FLQNFPRVVTRSAIDQYNRQLDSELQHVRDFVVLHYALGDRRDTPYWQYVADMALPPSLRHRIDLFRETGNVFHVAGELFGEDSWVQVMMGQGLAPRRIHPVVDAMSRDELDRFLGDIRSRTLRNVQGLPAHMDYLRSYCPAPVPS